MCVEERKDRVSIRHPQDSRHAVCLYLTAVCQVHASTSDLCEVPWWILIFQNFESEKGCRWRQDNRLELQMSWSNEDIWSLCPWWLRRSTGLSYWLPYRSNCNLHPVTMKSGMVACWRTGSGWRQASSSRRGKLAADKVVWRLHRPSLGQNGVVFVLAVGVEQDLNGAL